MKVKIEFDGISYEDGQPISFIKEMEVPDFKSRTIRLSIGEKITHAVTDQEGLVLEWLDKLDKSDLMYEHNLMVITDYRVSTLTLDELLDRIVTSQQQKDDLMAIYATIHDRIRNLSIEQQARQPFSHLQVGYQAVNIAHQNILKILDLPESEKLKLQ